MREFINARLKLTFWYVLIIMLVTSLFSAVIYKALTFEIGRGLRMQALRYVHREYIVSIEEDDNLFQEIKRRIIFNLILVNAGVLTVSGFAAYFLAGRTLAPIEAAMDEQKRFVADASHELRTPLTALKTEIEVFLRDKKLDLKESKKLLQSNLEEVDKMQSLSNYLLSFLKYEDGIKKLEFEEVDLAQVAGIAIEKDLREVIVNGNSISLVELATILLDNAIKYSHNGSKIKVITEKIGKHGVVSVKDFGIGIKHSEIPFVFKRFYRADSSRSKDKVDGYGLGLSIAKSIADLHYAKITVESETGKGSLFKVFFST